MKIIGKKMSEERGMNEFVEDVMDYTEYMRDADYQVLMSNATYFHNNKGSMKGPYDTWGRRECIDGKYYDFFIDDDLVYIESYGEDDKEPIFARCYRMR